MVQDVADAMLLKFNRDELICDFPEIFADLVGTDTNFEIVSSATLTTLRLFYEEKIIKKSLAVIFENSRLHRASIDINDSTPLGNNTWGTIKTEAMKDSY